MNKLGKFAFSMAKSSFKSVHELDKLGGLSEVQMVEIRKGVGILIIDDRDASDIASTLEKKYGFAKVKPVDSVPDTSQIEAYPIVVTDVDGVGAENSNGLKFARHIKSTYPLKQVVICSGQLKAAKYRDDLQYLNMFNGVYEKTKDSIEVLAELLNVCIVNLYDPSFVWRNVRANLLSRDNERKSDTDIFSVAEMEDEFVSQVLKNSKGKGKVGDLNWLETVVKMGKFTVGVMELLKAIITFTK